MSLRLWLLLLCLARIRDQSYYTAADFGGIRSILSRGTILMIRMHVCMVFGILRTLVVITCYSLSTA